MSGFWAGRRVFLTGHTGFKGGWLAAALSGAGAEVHGYALDPDGAERDLAVFAVAGVAGQLAADTRADIRDVAALERALAACRPEIVLHLAAQPLVRASYRDPVETWDVNVTGTARLFDAVGRVGGVHAVVNVTTDKCYENTGTLSPYREDDPMGGHDPYSASKAAVELLSASWRRSFWEGNGPNLATARAGNVIGGGDRGGERLLPDCVRAFEAGDPVVLRNPGAVRPWQHVLDPLAGYLGLARRLVDAPDLARGWNFGPGVGDEDDVAALADVAARAWGTGAQVIHRPDPGAPKEAAILRLDPSHARLALGWRTLWPVAEAVERTIAWERARIEGADMAAFTAGQIADHPGLRAELAA